MRPIRAFFPAFAVTAASLACLALRQVSPNSLFLGFPFSRDLIFLLALPLLLLMLAKKKPADFGLRVGETKRVLPLVFAALLASSPIIFLAARTPEFYNYYPVYGWTRESVPNFILYEAIILALMVSTEFFFRGFMMFGLKKYGEWPAILIQTIPYTIVHLGKPQLELPASFLAGIGFGWLDFRAKSVLPSIILHWCFNLVMDLCAIAAFSKMVS